MKKAIGILLALMLLVSVAATQTETFSNYINGLPLATTPFSGAEDIYVLQNGTSTKTTVAQLLGLPNPVAPQPLLPAEPISPTPAIDLNFTAGTYSGCTTWQQCLAITRAASQTCLSLTAVPSLTTVGANTPCITDYGWGSTYAASTNSLLWSEQFDNAAYTKTNVTVAANAAVAPDGNTTADSITDSSALGSHTVAQTLTVVSGTVYPHSVFVKSGTARYLQMSYVTSFSNGAYADFDATTCTLTSTGQLSTPDATPNTNIAGTQQLSNGWCRIWLINTATASASTTANLIMIPFSTATRLTSYVGTGSTMYVWGGQVDSSGIAVPSPYKATTSATVSSDADVVSVVSSSPLDNLIRGSQGYIVGNTGTIPGASGYVLSRNGTTDAFIQIADQTSIQARVGGVARANTALGSLPLLNAGPGNLGSSWNGSGISIVADGSTATDSATPYGASFNSFMGSADGTQGFLNANIRRLFAGTTKPSDATLQALAPAQGTPLAPVGQAWFFSGTGSDSNDCKTSGTACQTVSKLNSLTYTRSNTISIDSANGLTGCILFNSVNLPFSSQSFPIVLGAYNGSQFALTSNCNGDVGAIAISGVSGVTVQDCLIRPSGSVSPTARAGIYLTSSSSSRQGGWTVQRCDIGGFKGTSNVGGIFGGQIFLTLFNTAGIENISMLNNTLHGLSGATSTDDNGIIGFGDGLNTFTVTTQGNLVFNNGGSAGQGNGIAGNGIESAGYNGATVSFNISHDNGVNVTTCGGPVSIGVSGSTGVLNQFEESYNTKITGVSACDGDGFDNDQGTQNGITQYVYSHDNQGVGFLDFIATSSGITWHDNTYRYSISEHDFTQASSGGSAHIQNSATIANANFYNLTLYQNNTQSGAIGFGMCCNITSALSGVFANNIVAVVSSGGNANFVNSNSNSATQPPNFLYKSNDWFPVSGSIRFQIGATVYSSLATWQAATPGGDTGAITTTPSFSGTGGTGGTCSWTPNLNNGPQPCPSVYVLSGGSAAKSAGTDLQGGGFISVSPGIRDYYANTIPGSGSCWNIGADGACP